MTESSGRASDALPPVAAQWTYKSALSFEPYVGCIYRLTAAQLDVVAEEITRAEPGARGLHSIRNLLRAYLPSAGSVLVEFDYFDVDYRSEFSASHETSFAARNPQTRRVHFFKEIAQDHESPLDFVERAHPSYLGYAILRPQYPGAIGRSLISPNGMSDTHNVHDTLGVLAGVELGRRIRTAVPEVVELFGLTMRAYGVPYMQQDEHLLRCAHVSAWICHYTAVLRGRVARRVTSRFHFAEDATGSYGRQYPSHGLSTTVLTSILRKLELPPEIIDAQAIVTAGRNRKLEWYHRPGLQSEIEETTDSLAHTRLWTIDALTSEICRYLNSGIPVILADDVNEHTQVICGYLRNSGASDRALGGDPGSAAVNGGTITRETQEKAPDATSERASAASGGVQALVLQDDGTSPYTLLPIELVANRIISSTGKPLGRMSLVVPLPRGLWMSGAIAEQLGAEVLRAQMKRRRQRLDSWLAANKIEGDLRKEYLQTYASFKDKPTKEERIYAIRSYVLSGSELKISVRARISDAAVARTLGYTRLPKYVWVIEMLLRDKRTDDDETACVVATVALDASVVSDGPAVDKAASVIFMHMPGQVADFNRIIEEEVTDREIEGEGNYAEPTWYPTTLQPYATGRWRPDAEWYALADIYYLNNKTS